MKNKNRLHKIGNAERAVTEILHQHWMEDDLAAEHLERAKSHLAEAWLAADGQRARTVQKLVEDLESVTKLFAAVAAAAPGTEFEIAGKTFVKQGQPENDVEAK
jgi:hypothetical protein